MRRRARSGNHDERILPLINIVFLLLIFFMLAGRLSAPDPFATEPPASASEAPAAAGIEVLAAADGGLALDGRIVPETELVAAIERRLAAGASSDMRLRVDGALTAARAIGIMDRLRKAGAEKIHLVTVPAGR